MRGSGVRHFGAKETQAMYVFLHDASAGPRRAWGHVPPPPPPEEAVSVLHKFVHYMILRVYTAMVLGGLVEVWAVLGCFNGPHDGYANS